MIQGIVTPYRECAMERFRERGEGWVIPTIHLSASAGYHGFQEAITFLSQIAPVATKAVLKRLHRRYQLKTTEMLLTLFDATVEPNELFQMIKRCSALFFVMMTAPLLLPLAPEKLLSFHAFFALLGAQREEENIPEMIPEAIVVEDSLEELPEELPSNEAPSIVNPSVLNNESSTAEKIQQFIKDNPYVVFGLFSISALLALSFKGIRGERDQLAARVVELEISEKVLERRTTDLVGERDSFQKKSQELFEENTLLNNDLQTAKIDLELHLFEKKECFSDLAKDAGEHAKGLEKLFEERQTLESKYHNLDKLLFETNATLSSCLVAKEEETMKFQQVQSSFTLMEEEYTNGQNCITDRKNQQWWAGVRFIIATVCAIPYLFPERPHLFQDRR